LVGSAFRNRVGEILCEIPYGKTVTYGWIAGRIAKERGCERMSAQAVGGAVGHNPICIIVPCHRVVGANGSLTGYGGGIQRKKALLELEGNDMSKFTIPAKGTAL
jgi:methylated-DNA-[protein]-cysteine S-methyltransferase